MEISNSTTVSFELSIALMSGVPPLIVCASISAPFSRSSWTRSSWPEWQAWCSGVHLKLSLALMSALQNRTLIQNMYMTYWQRGLLTKALKQQNQYNDWNKIRILTKSVPSFPPKREHVTKKYDLVEHHRLFTALYFLVFSFVRWTQDWNPERTGGQRKTLRLVNLPNL